MIQAHADNPAAKQPSEPWPLRLAHSNALPSPLYVRRLFQELAEVLKDVSQIIAHVRQEGGGGNGQKHYQQGVLYEVLTPLIEDQST